MSEYNIPTIMNTDKDIYKIHVFSEGWIEAEHDVEILPCEENGEMAKITWFAVFVRGELHNKVNSKFVDQVIYID